MHQMEYYIEGCHRSISVDICLLILRQWYSAWVLECMVLDTGYSYWYMALGMYAELAQSDESL